MIKLKCQCCGIEQEFTDLEAAFYAGWDAPPHFTQYVSCNVCPGVCCIGIATHEKAHADWAKNGRPEEFGARCLTDKDWGKSEEKFQSEMKAVEGVLHMAASAEKTKH